MPPVSTLQVLRALAAWMVVYHHYMQLYYNFAYDSVLGRFFACYGNRGVDIFFVISGFIMFYTQTLRPRSAIAFFTGRLLRIVPVYWFYTFLAMVVARLCINMLHYTWTTASLLQSLLFIPHANPAGLGDYPLLVVGWSLNYEMLFYLSLALSLSYSKHYAFVWVGLTFCALPLLWPASWPFSTMLSNAYWYEFALGIGLGYLYCKTAWFTAPYRIWLLLLALSSVLLLVYQDSVYRFQSYAALAVLLALLLETYAPQNNRVYQGLLLLGNSSYSTYLCHMLLLFMLHDYYPYLPSMATQVSLLGALSCSVAACSLLSYRFIEPLWHLPHRNYTPLTV